MNMISWLSSTSKWMHADRPDIFDSPSDALDSLEGWVESMRAVGYPGSVEMGGFTVTLDIEDNMEEWTLSKKISTALIDLDGGDAEVYSWVVDSKTMTVGPEGIPLVTDIFADEDEDDDEEAIDN